MDVESRTDDRSMWHEVEGCDQRPLVPRDLHLSNRRRIIDRTTVYAKVKEYWDIVVNTLWRLAEVHFAKLVLLILTVIAVDDICALNTVLVLFVGLAACFPSLANLLSVLLCGFLSVFSILRMVYQLRVIPSNLYTAMDHGKNGCSIDFPLFQNSTIRWLGFQTVSYVGTYVLYLILSIVFIAGYFLILYRQRHIRRLRGESYDSHTPIFPDADPKKWDSSLIDTFKFFLNYGYYKFGLEVSLTIMVLVAWGRMDFLGSLLLLWLIVFCVVSRRICRLLWRFFVIYVAATFVLQYVIFVGLPPILCFEYPWSTWLNTTHEDGLVSQNDNLVSFLDLASYSLSLKTHKLIGDFFLLIAVSCQEYAFRAEYSKTTPPAAGDNESVYRNGHYDFVDANPHYDFIIEQKNFVDFLKMAVFMYGHWFTVVMVFVAGLGGVSLFALGYIILAFMVLWKGTGLYTMKNYKRTLFIWKTILLYNVTVMFFKVVLQLVGCVFVDKLLNWCSFRQLFSIVCVSSASGSQDCYYFKGQDEFDKNCPVQKSETQIGFDTLAFLFLVMQLRILHSYYFQHCMLEFRAESVLINRGAALTNQLKRREMKEQDEQQQKKFIEIRDRTEKIREIYEQQQKRAGTGAFIPESYAQGSSVNYDDPFPEYDIQYLGKNAKRGGDYYMFEYDPNEDVPAEYIESFAPEVTPGATDSTKLDPAQILHTAIQRDLDIAQTLCAVRDAEKIDDENKRMIEAVSVGPSSAATATSSGENNLLKDAEEKNDDGGTENVSSASRYGEKAVIVLKFVRKLLHACLNWAATFLNRRSRDHRYVAFVLSKEKAILKKNFRQNLFDTKVPVESVREKFETSSLACVSCDSDIDRLEKDAMDNWQQKNVYSRIVIAIAYCISAHTDILCYIIAVIGHARCGGLISLVLPLLVFFWGTLATPRPPRIFWVVMIGYTQLCVITKFIFQFGFFSWNKTSAHIRTENAVDSWPGIVGVRKEDFYAFWDVVLLVALFFHRYVLRKMGLWKDVSSNQRAAEEDNAALSAAVSGDVETSERCNCSQQVTVQESGDNALVNVNEVSNTSLGNSDSETANPNENGIQSKKGGFISRLFYPIFHPEYRYIRDLYPFMFLLDVLCFFIIVFGFSSFGYGGSGSVVKDIQSNRVPITFVVMLIVLSIMIVIDRALPAWLNKTAQLLYVVKCIYLLVSAWQIRNGYPSLCVGNLITHSYGFANMIMFKIFMCLPFLFELRTSIDWAWTDTSMPIFDFFNMENFFATIYSLKCSRTYEQNFPAKRGEAKSHTVKYAMGIPVILILILILWGPLIAFALLNRIGTVLLPVSVQMTISLEGYPPLYSIEAQGIELENVSPQEYQKLTDMFSDPYNALDQKWVSRARQAVSFINEYSTGDILKIRFRPESERFWSISTDSLTALKYELERENKTVNTVVKLRFERTRVDSTKEPIVHSGQIVVPLLAGSQMRDDFLEVLNGVNGTKTEVTLLNALPPYVTIPNEGEIRPTYTLHSVMYESAVMASDTAFSNLTLSLSHQADAGMLWSCKLVENAVTRDKTLALDSVKYGNDSSVKYVQMVAFVDRVFPSLISKFAQGGIIAMYIALVLLIWQKVRGVLTNQPLDVIISEIPNPDHLLKICQDIYLVREAKDFVLEQDLYAKLIFLFRSPSTLIKWTRYKAKTE
uniref:PIEZO domain-containing protein n=1 Tax=Syphacia muris TaxID=451379 RepID=A0A158R607_9BILA